VKGVAGAAGAFRKPRLSSGGSGSKKHKGAEKKHTRWWSLSHLVGRCGLNQ